MDEDDEDWAKVFDEHAEVSSKTYEVQLEPDKAVNGSLAFRLAGNRTRGVFVRYINRESLQVSSCCSTIRFLLSCRKRDSEYSWRFYLK